MKTKIILSITAFVMLFCSVVMAQSAKSWSQEPTTFRNIAWGMGEKEADQIADFDRCTNFEQTNRICSSSFKIGDVTVTGIFIFTPKEGFSSVALDFKPEDYDFLKSAFIEKYGTPTNTQQMALENRMGAKFQNELIFWEGEKVKIFLFRYSNKVTEGLGGVGLKSYADSLSVEKDAKTKKAAGDF